MTTDVVKQEESAELTLDLTTLDTPEKRFSGLSKTFTSAIVIIAEMQKNRDWESLTKEDGEEYKNLTDLVQDALQISDSYARRLVQTADAFYTPLESVTVEGTVISISSTEAAKLGTDGMNQVVSEVEGRLDEENSPEGQSNLINAVTKDVLEQKKGNTDSSGFDDMDFDDDFGDEFDDDFDDDFDATPSSGPSPNQDKQNGGNPSEKANPATKEPAEKQKPSDYLGPIQTIMSGGKEYKTEEDLAELDEPLRKFVETVNYLANLDHEEITELIDKDKRGATYSIRKAASNLTLIVSSVETSSWVLEQI